MEPKPPRLPLSLSIINLLLGWLISLSFSSLSCSALFLRISRGFQSENGSPSSGSGRSFLGGPHLPDLICSLLLSPRRRSPWFSNSEPPHSSVSLSHTHTLTHSRSDTICCNSSINWWYFCHWSSNTLVNLLELAWIWNLELAS